LMPDGSLYQSRRNRYSEYTQLILPTAIHSFIINLPRFTERRRAQRSQPPLHKFIAKSRHESTGARHPQPPAESVLAQRQIERRDCQASSNLQKRVASPDNSQQPTTPVLHPPPHQVPSRPLIRRLVLVRLACFSYASHPSPGIPHEQPQHVSVDVDTHEQSQPPTYPLQQLEPGSTHHLPSCPSLCQLQ
jgi:hypothetical protein